MRWAGSHPTNTRTNGHNTTNNNQQPSKHPAHKTRPDQAVLAHGAPQVLRADNGPEFIAAAMGRWASEHDTLQAFIPPGQPWHNGFVESLHNRMRDELLEDNMFEGLDHARALIGAWSHRYNEEHPHSALDWLSPNQYARQWAQHHQ